VTALQNVIEAEEPSALLGFALALAIGALIGVDRERKKASGDLGTGGLRTFTLLAETGALAAWIAVRLDAPWIFAVAGMLVTAMLVAGYVMEVRAKPGALGLTTEIAGLVTFLLGGAVLFGERELAVALAIATAAILAFKEPLHGLVGRIAGEDLQAALKLLIATFIVLPVLPDRPLDPWGVLNPYKIWLLVVLMSALSLGGYVATRLLGSERGLLVTGLAGGLVSSTAVTLGFARQSKEREQGPPDALAAGLLFAWAVMFVRVGVVIALVYRPLLAPLAWPMGTMGALTLAMAALHVVRGQRARTPATELKLRNPFRLTASIRFAAFFALTLLWVELARRTLPPSGIYAVAALAGLTDVDAITLSMIQQARAGDALAVAAAAIVVAALANTAAKCGLVLALGAPALKSRVGVATAVIMAGGAAVLLLA
jgi:uncharacterized membrane protein (DUF4010 family)